MNRKESLESIAQMLEVPTSQLSEDLTPAQVPAWDSLGHINIIAFLDSEFDIILLEEEMVNVDSLKSILDIIEKRGGFSH